MNRKILTFVFAYMCVYANCTFAFNETKIVAAKQPKAVVASPEQKNNLEKNDVTVLATSVIEGNTSKAVKEFNDKFEKLSCDVTDNRNELKLEIDILAKDLAECKQSLQSAINKMNENTHDVAEAKRKSDDLETQLKIKSEAVVDEVNARLALFSDKQAQLLKEINASVNLQPIIDSKTPLIVSFDTNNVIRDGKTGVIYVVKSGDSLSKIADKYKVLVKDIVDSNDLKNSQNIKIEQELFIPIK